MESPLKGGGGSGVVHCTKNYLNLRIKTAPVTGVTDATLVYVRLFVYTYTEIRHHTVAYAPTETGLVFMRRFSKDYFWDSV